MDPTRQRRREEINKDLAFIQSSLAYPDPDGYQDFLTHLVCNLLEEGNALFKDRDWEQAVKMFTEGLNVSNYAELEEIHIPQGLLESLFVNRATAFHSMGDYEHGVADCDSALQVCQESHRALYRKALCLKELGKHREAYNCTTHPLLVSRPDMKVSELAQELTAKLGLKIRKPYVSAKDQSLISRSVPNGNLSAEASKVSSAHIGNGLNPLVGLTPVRFPSMPQTSFPTVVPSIPEPAASVVPDMMDSLEDSELIGDDLDSLLDGIPHESSENHTPAKRSGPHRTSSSSHTVPSVLPAPSPQLPPAFFNSPVNQLSSLDSFPGCSISTSALDALDDLSASGGAVGPVVPNVAPLSAALDALDGLEVLDDILDPSQNAAAEMESAGDQNLDELDELDSLEIVSDPLNVDVPKVSLKAVEPLDSLDALDALDLFPPVDGAVSIRGTGLDSLSDFCSAETSGSGASAASPVKSAHRNHKERKKNVQAMDKVCNPLSSTHDFLQACSSCFPRTGKGAHSFVHKPELVHSCEGDILLCRRKADPPQEWTRVRPIPIVPPFNGPFVLCRELPKGACKYGEKCNFAFNQLEIDVWTLERQGMLVRKLLFESTANRLDPVSSVTHLLQEDKGVFMFLCQECFNNKPRIISKRSKHKRTVCSNMDVQHSFDANKCLVFVMSTQNVTYKKVRPLRLLSRLDLCRQAIRDICLREDECHLAHSVIELKTWRVQQETGISPEEIVKVSTQYNEKLEQNFNRMKTKRVSSGNDGSKPRGAAAGGGEKKGPDLRMKFVCAQCWQGCNISEPDKYLKHCKAKAKHPWMEERSVLLVKSTERSKWVLVRPLPHDKNYPRCYEICNQIKTKGKCNYSGNCQFAHSPEEKEMWMYMKDNDMPYMQQIYNIWLSLTVQSLQADGAELSRSNLEEKNIVMPTDYAEPLDGFHCRLCGKHSNSERQWQQHISTEKHKDRVFSCEGEEEALTSLAWSYRFPGTRFELCNKLDGGCPDGVSCDSAHSPEELQEWTERRDFLRQKLAKAREDMLVMPDEFDFGKYNFLLQD